MNHLPSLMKRLVKTSVFRIMRTFAPTRLKEYRELQYWKIRKEEEGELGNDHYEHFYTALFGLDPSYYEDKVLLDLGCGPRGSLEWASMAARRIGLDPLAGKYLRLGADRHDMEYIDAPGEDIPLDDAECDAVFSFNSLDHVANVERTLQEIKRVTRPGGIFLLLVEVNHPPTDWEPHELTPRDLIDGLEPEFECEDVRVYAAVVPGGYKSIRAGVELPNPRDTDENGFLSAKFVRTGTPD